MNAGEPSEADGVIYARGRAEADDEIAELRAEVVRLTAERDALRDAARAYFNCPAETDVTARCICGDNEKRLRSLLGEAGQ